MRYSLLSSIGVAAVSVSGLALAQEVAPSTPPLEEVIVIQPAYERTAVRARGSFEIGVRIAYSAPIGKIWPDSNTPGLSDYISGALPFWFDIGGRIGRHVYIGAFLEFAPGFIGNHFDDGAPNGMTTGAIKGSAGANVHVHILPLFVFDPWVGVGVGGAFAGANSYYQGVRTTNSFVGYEINVQAGGDYRVSKYFGFGPFVSFAFGQYTSCSETQNGQEVVSGSIKNPSFHEWFSAGIRGSFNL